MTTYMMLNILGYFCIAVGYGGWLYKITELWASAIQTTMRSNASRTAYWVCLSNEHHGYLNPNELAKLKAEAYNTPLFSLPRLTGHLMICIATGFTLIGGIYASL